MINTATMTAAEHTRLETVHGELLHEAAALTAANNYFDASVARARAAFVAKLLGWGSC